MNIEMIMKAMKLLPTELLVEFLKSYCDDFLYKKDENSLAGIETISILILERSKKVKMHGDDLETVAKEFAAFRESKKNAEVVVPGDQEKKD